MEDRLTVRDFSPKSDGKKHDPKLANIEVSVVPDAGHAVVFDRPEIINPEIIRFLKEE